jgi:large subunit ribosomal protein L30
MIAIIRIRGQVKIDRDVEAALYSLNLRRKYACTVIHPEENTKGILMKLRNFVAYGDIDDKTLEDLLLKRGKLIDKKKKTDLKKAAEDIKKGKNPRSLNIKPFFRLHPPRGGIDSKIHYPKGVLGDHKEKINELIRRML